MTYEASWRCLYCDKKGTVSIPYSEACDALWAAAVEQHSSASPDCQELHGTRGLAIRAAGVLPA